ncbi:hypothetical protein RWE87_27425 (plasmid) [Sinorhizobium meliloti]|uniref:hypothetical protein n=1 Tax=Rhizobium meliloti TaxID=382 RepID=UPI00299CE374|nr:hypothetical protein [Sinorhizobium meliloti]MDX0980294.1 hypothetical protein [Sinorhizobium medicae]
MTVISAAVTSEKIILVEGSYNNDGTITVIKDETFNLEGGDRQLAYVVMHKRIADRLSQDIEQVVLKASAGGQYAAKTVVLHSAELRGVFLSAVPAGVNVTQVQKNAVSRNYGSRKVDEYVKDDNFIGEHFSGAGLRKGSREAAILLLAARG